MSKSVEEATTAVRDYLEKTNRPYSSNDIFNNLQNKYTKAAIGKSLEVLVTDKQVCERVNGKQKIYFLCQDLLPVNNEQLKQLDEQFELQSKQIAELKESIGSMEQKLKVCKESIPLESLKEQLDSTKERHSTLINQLSMLEQKFKNIDPEVHLKVKYDHQLLVTEWKKRKRLASQVIDMIMENYSKPKKAFLEEVGIETDEDVNVVPPM